MISEKLSPQQSFKFLNNYLDKMTPAINDNQGFIDKYIGDAIMALFPNEPDDAVQAAIEMNKALKLLNKDKIKEDEIEPDFVSALKLCKRRRIGPSRPESNRELFYKKDMGILARGGFSFDLSKRVLDLETTEFKKLLKII